MFKNKFVEISIEHKCPEQSCEDYIFGMNTRATYSKLTIIWSSEILQLNVRFHPFRYLR